MHVCMYVCILNSVSNQVTDLVGELAKVLRTEFVPYFQGSIYLNYGRPTYIAYIHTNILE